MSDEPLFPEGCTHVEVTCWKCGHKVELKPDQMSRMTKFEFESRAKCSKCGTDWPQVYRFPKPPSRWGLG